MSQVLASDAVAGCAVCVIQEPAAGRVAHGRRVYHLRDGNLDICVVTKRKGREAYAHNFNYSAVVMPPESFGKCRIDKCWTVGDLADGLCVDHWDRGIGVATTIPRPSRRRKTSTKQKPRPSHKA